jgi:hypothetical protein
MIHVPTRWPWGGWDGDLARDQGAVWCMWLAQWGAVRCSRGVRCSAGGGTCRQGLNVHGAGLRAVLRGCAGGGDGASGAGRSTPSPGFGLIFLSSDSDRFRSRQVRIRIGFAGLGSDSDRFRRARFGFGSVSPCQVRIRIGFAGPGSDSDRFWKGLRV